MSEWKEYKLGELCNFQSGTVFPNSYQGGVSGDYPFIKVSDMNLPGNERIIRYANNWINKKTCKELQAKIHPKNATVFAKTGIALTFNRRRLLKQPSIIDNNMMSAVAGDNITPLFLYYLLCTIDFNYIVSGTAVPYININELKNIDVKIPSLSEQRAIASVLSSIDDKIDLLHRENKTLEAMAETLFRKWFIEEAEDDWEGVSLGDSTLSTIIKSGINFFEGEKFYLETNDVNNTDIVGGIPVTYADRPSRANMEPVVYSVWFSKKQGTRKLLMFDEYSKYTNKLILSTGFTGLKTTELSHYYIWCYVMSPQFQKIKDNLVTGSVQPDITNDNVKKIIIPKPDNETLLKFNSVVKEFFYKISLNQVQIRTLTQLRDTLLPKLMSGEVRVDLCQS